MHLSKDYEPASSGEYRSGYVLFSSAMINRVPSLAPSLTPSSAKHISNYDGHLLSDQSGPPTIPENKPVPIPANFEFQFTLSKDACENGMKVGSIGGMKCFSFQWLQDQYLEADAVAFLSENPGWEITAYENGNCTGEALGKVGPSDGKTCKPLSKLAKGFNIVPLFNANW
jgi:hypothetical protein